MVLKLNAEPGIEQWWVTVTNLMHDHFNAERASLVVPRDSSDIENVSTILAHAWPFSRFTMVGIHGDTSGVNGVVAT